MSTIAIDDPLAWTSVSLSVMRVTSYSFTVWHHFSMAITASTCFVIIRIDLNRVFLICGVFQSVFIC